MEGHRIAELLANSPDGFFKVHPQEAYMVVGNDALPYKIKETVIIPYVFEKQLSSLTSSTVLLFKNNHSVIITENQKVLTISFETKELSINDFEILINLS